MDRNDIVLEQKAIRKITGRFVIPDYQLGYVMPKAGECGGKVWKETCESRAMRSWPGKSYSTVKEERSADGGKALSGPNLRDEQP